MAKEVYYFKHDYNARNDPKLVRLLLERGLAGIGAYWCLIEMLYEQGGQMPLSDLPTIARQLKTQGRLLEDLVNNFGLFSVSSGLFSSSSVIRRISEKNARTESARFSALARWKGDANAMRTHMRTHNERNAIRGEESIYIPPTPAPGAADNKNRDGDIPVNLTNIFTTYEESFGGMLSPLDADRLRDAESTYGADRVLLALAEAKRCKARVPVPYVLRCLARWQDEGLPRDAVPQDAVPVRGAAPASGRWNPGGYLGPDE